jgi:hypothetical protein
VIAGTKNESKTGSIEKKFLSSARFAKKNVEKNKSPEQIKNKQSVIYAIGLEKKAQSSRFAITFADFVICRLPL